MTGNHQHNRGTGLRGAAYSVRSCSEPTRDDIGAGRWIALDESGQHGDQLQRENRYVALGVVAIDDVTAARIIEDLRDRARRDHVAIQAPELSFSKSFAGKGTGKAQRRAILADLLGAGGALAERASVYLIDTDYFIVVKLVDLLIEEAVHASGTPSPGPEFYRTLARDLALEGPRALGDEGFTRLLGAAGTFFAKRNTRADIVSVDELFKVIKDSRNRARRRRAPQARKATEVLDLLLRTRAAAEEFASDRRAETGTPEADSVRDSMEPLIPCVAAAIGSAAEAYRAVRALGDEHRLLTDSTLELMHKGVNALQAFEGLRERNSLEQLVRGRSCEHPSLQLADLVAGSGYAVGLRCSGEETEAGLQLAPAIIPLIDPQSLMPYVDVRRNLWDAVGLDPSEPA